MFPHDPGHNHKEHNIDKYDHYYWQDESPDEVFVWVQEAPIYIHNNKNNVMKSERLSVLTHFRNHSNLIRLEQTLGAG